MTWFSLEKIHYQTSNFDIRDIFVRVTFVDNNRKNYHTHTAKPVLNI